MDSGDLLQIRYSKLTFTLEFLEDTRLPVHKISMLRGGIGEMLLRGNCIGDRDCERCGFREECVVQQIYYHKLKIVPDYVQEKESLGYLYECRDRRTDFRRGSRMKFHMILFGNVIVHFPAVLQAVSWLGIYGMGRDKAVFRVVEIENQRGEKVLAGNEVRLSCLRPDFIADYVEERLEQLGRREQREGPEGQKQLEQLGLQEQWEGPEQQKQPEQLGLQEQLERHGQQERQEQLGRREQRERQEQLERPEQQEQLRRREQRERQGQQEQLEQQEWMRQSGGTLRMRFVTPLTQKHEGQFLKNFQEQALIYSIYRRIFLLNCMEGNEMERRCPYNGALEIAAQRVQPAKVPRYSATHGRQIWLEGIEGETEIRVESAFMPFLLAGELAHIGKNTSMGFGQYVVE